MLVHNAIISTLQKIEPMQKQEFERRIEINLHKYAITTDKPNDFLVQIIEMAGSYLNLQTISDYAK